MVSYMKLYEVLNKELPNQYTIYLNVDLIKMPLFLGKEILIQN